jgi:hypothetical protein
MFVDVIHVQALCGSSRQPARGGGKGSQKRKPAPGGQQKQQPAGGRDTAEKGDTEAASSIPVRPAGTGR